MERVEVLHEKIPLDGFAEKYLGQLLRKYRLYPNSGCYEDCRSGGELACLYSARRCLHEI